MRRLFHDGRHAELLDLPSQFNGALDSWLGSLPYGTDAAADADAQRTLRTLHALHQLRLQRYEAAAESMLRAADEPQVLGRSWVEGLRGRT